MIGNQDEVTDMRFVGTSFESPTHIAVATNSEAVRLYDLASLSCTTSLVGHRDIVLCLDAALVGTSGSTTTPQCILATGAKDQAVRVWDSVTGRCIGLGTGHVGAVTSVAFSRKALPSASLTSFASASASSASASAGVRRPFMVTVGADKLLKVWGACMHTYATRPT
jgi:U3 small nucleolar RNA-associated protein 13